MPLSALSASLLTLSYTDQFNFPLTTQEVWQRLVGVRASEAAVRMALQELASQGLVKKSGRMWLLSRGMADIELRKTRAQIAALRWQEVETLKRIMSWIPWIRGIAVTGSLAMDNLQAHSDIDLMVVTTRGRLWLARPLVALSAWVVGKRRTWQGDEADSWCFNLWLSEADLAMPVHKQNLYTAYEVCQAKWILDRGQVQQKFYQANGWVDQFLPQYYSACLSTAPHNHIAATKFNHALILRWLGRRLLDAIETLVFWLQYLYMYPHITWEKVGLGRAFFHPRPTQDLIYQRWKQSLLGLIAVKSQQVVLATGVFDILHAEHRQFLQQAKQRGELLAVGVETDRRVKQIKGASRPINNQSQRRFQLAALPETDLVFILPEKFDHAQDHLSLLQVISPQILAVSSHTAHLAAKKILMQQVGGKVEVVHQRNPRISTSQIIARRG